jgi:hypothetical protein
MSIVVQFGNLDTGESMAAQYAPTELKETYGANYTSLVVPGLSHQILQFISGENAALDADYDFNQLVNPKVSIDDQRRFLLSLLVPRRGASSVTTGSPARVLFFWPKLFSMTCRMTKLEITHTWFNADGSPAIFRAKPTLVEARISRLYAEDVRAGGTVRPA